VLEVGVRDVATGLNPSDIEVPIETRGLDCQHEARWRFDNFGSREDLI
jgi:hypothetical protein